MIKKLFFICVIVLIRTIYVSGQQTDFGTWVTVEVKGKLFKLVNFDIIPELRLWDNSTRVKSMLGETEVSVPFAKYFELGVAYRVQLDISTPDYFKRSQRFGVFAQVNYKIKRLKISYKAIYHQEYTNLNTSELGDVPEIYHRHKIGLKYNIKKSPITPYVSADMYFMLKPAWKSEERKIRTSIGLEYKLSKKAFVSLEYKYQHEFNTPDPKTDHILGIGVEYNL
jgi:hypothetical protein